MSRGAQSRIAGAVLSRLGLSLMVLAALWIFFELWSYRVNASIAQAEQTLKAIAANVSSMTHAAVSHARILQTEGNRQLRELCENCRRPVSLQVSGLSPNNGGNGFTTRARPGQADPETASYLFGKGEMPQPGSQAAGEMESILRLNPLMRDVRRNIPEAQWIYYTSESRFTNIFPFEGPGMAESLEWTDEFLSHPLYAETAPAKNPGRLVRWHDAYIDQAGKGLLTSVLAPLSDGNGRFRGIFGIDITLDTLTGYLQGPGIKLGTPMIITGTGQVIAHPTAIKSTDMAVAQFADILPDALKPFVGDLKAAPSGTWIKQQKWRVHALDVRDAPWRLVFLIDSSHLAFKTLAGMGTEGVSLILFLLLVVALQNRFRITERLRESETLFKGLADTQPGFVYVADRDGRDVFLNAGFAAYTGQPINDLLGDGWTRAVHPEDLERISHAWKTSIDTGAPYEVEYRLRRHDGAYRWFLGRARPVRDEKTARIVRWVGISLDIDDKMQTEAEIQRLNAELEKRVAERTTELTAANRELEAFTFATSHDLRGPLGRINSFCTLLEQQYRDRLEGNGLIYLEFIRQNSTRLTQLVDDLLQHARVSQQVLELKPVDVMARVLTVLEESAEDVREVHADVRISVPPVRVMADPRALTQVLSNLVQNALKYSAVATPPMIEIGGEKQGANLLLWVRDNGIGFDMAYHDKIFEMFSRLQTYNEYEGSGIGLALVKRAVERIGGRVWAESRPGKGATFFLELQIAAEELSV